MSRVLASRFGGPSSIWQQLLKSRPNFPSNARDFVVSKTSGKTLSLIYGCLSMFMNSVRLHSRSFTCSRVLRSSESSTAGASLASTNAFIRWYLQMIRKHPVLTKSVMTASIYTSADLTSQIITPHATHKESFDLRLSCNNAIRPSSYILMKQQLFPTIFQKSFFVSYISSRGHFSTMSQKPPHTSNVDNAKVDVDFRSDANSAPEMAPRIKTKRLDKTARHIMQILEKEAVQSVKAERVIPDIKPGYIVELKVEVPENKRRVSTLKGIVIAKRNAGLSTTFRIRRLVAGIGVESVFPLYSPNIKQIKVLDKKRVRRAKLYYLREKMGSSGKK